MGKDSAIEWTHNTFNPWWGCTKVSAGCDHCYAETFDRRVGGAHWGPGQPRRTFGDKHWAEPLKWHADAIKAGERRRVFCASMADWADAEAPAGQRDRLWDLIKATPGLDWLLLTKRHGRIARCLPADWGQGYPNVWLGVSVENQEAADTRIPVLLGIPARVRFLSCEPLLGPVDLKHIREKTTVLNAIYGERTANSTGCVVEEDLPAIDWVIVGGESGPGARPMHPQWARTLRDQCHEAAAEVAFHFKQWGEYGLANWQAGNSFDRGGFTFGGQDIDESRVRLLLPNGQEPDLHNVSIDMEMLARVGKHKAGRLLDGRTWDEYPRPVLVGAAP
jgi:protein gp37